MCQIGSSQRRYDNRAPGSTVEVLPHPKICPSLLPLVGLSPDDSETENTVKSAASLQVTKPNASYISHLPIYPSLAL